MRKVTIYLANVDMEIGDTLILENDQIYIADLHTDGKYVPGMRSDSITDQYHNVYSSDKDFIQIILAEELVEMIAKGFIRLKDGLGTLKGVGV